MFDMVGMVVLVMMVTVRSPLAAQRRSRLWRFKFGLNPVTEVEGLVDHGDALFKLGANRREEPQLLGEDVFDPPREPLRDSVKVSAVCSQQTVQTFVPH